MRPTRPGKVKAKSKSSWDGAPIMRAKPEKGGIGNCSAPFLLSTCFVRLSDPEIQPAPPSSPCLFIKNEYFYSVYRGHRSLSHVHETPRPGFVMYFASFMDTTAPLRRVQKCEVVFTKDCLPRLSGRPARNARLDNSTCGLFGGRGRNSIRGGK